MTLDNAIMALTFISSAIALFFATRKQKHDEQNLDADTISKLYDLIDKQEGRYQAFKVESENRIQTLQNEFDAYKNSTSAQIADIASDNVKLRRWAKRLIAQLEAAGIVPVKFDE
jgi:uncharacterized protein YlxW (UPF0749 family)